MKYANTAYVDNQETIITILPLSAVRSFDPNHPPPFTYAVPDEVLLGWVKVYTAPPTCDPVTGDMTESGTFTFQAPAEPSKDALQRQYTDAVQNRLDRFAGTRGYDGILSACSYAASSDPQFHTEGQYCMEARDSTWGACYQIMAQVLSGALPLPDFDTFIAMLPPLEGPDESSR
jgi:hypothetical protein